MEQKGPSLTVDVIIEYPDGRMVLIKRKNDPFKGHWALPGGFVDIGETVEQAAIREAKEETSIEVKLVKLVGVYSDPQRDPRRHTVSVVFHAVPVTGEPKAADDAAEIMLTQSPLEHELAFDHARIIRDHLPGSEETVEND